MAIKDGMPCLICGAIIHDLINSPKDRYSEKSKMIIAAWMAGVEIKKKIEPGEFYACPECMGKVDPECWV